jgi:hypothetical protein
MPDNKPPVAHYSQGAIQPIDFMEGSFTRAEYIGYLKGNVIKYVSRFQHKGTPEADLIKAQTYLGWLLDAMRRDASVKHDDDGE